MATETPKSEKQTVFMVGPSYDAEHGDKRVLDKDLADSLVERKLARYPDNHEG